MPAPITAIVVILAVTDYSQIVGILSPYVVARDFAQSRDLYTVATPLCTKHPNIGEWLL